MFQSYYRNSNYYEDRISEGLNYRLRFELRFAITMRMFLRTRYGLG